MNSYQTAILITGASGGLGKAVVRAAISLEDIDRVIATDIKESITTEYRDIDRVTGIRLDAGSEESLNTLRDKLTAERTRIKYIVNNAGVMLFYPVSEANEKMLEMILRVNTFGPVLTVSRFIGDLAETGGRVIQISSDSVRFSGFFQPYNSTKIAMESFSIAMRQELKLLGVQLILIRPGAIRTHLLDQIKAGKRPFHETRYEKNFNKFEAMALKRVGKTLEPDRIAGIVIKAIKSKRPRLVYSINKNRMINYLIRFPQRWVDHLVVNRIR